MPACWVNVAPTGWFIHEWPTLDWTTPHSLFSEHFSEWKQSACACLSNLLLYFHPMLHKRSKNVSVSADLSSVKWISVEFLQMGRPSSPSFGFLCSDCIKTATSVIPSVVSLPWEAELWYYMILACKILVKCSIILGFALSFSQFSM